MLIILSLEIVKVVKSYSKGITFDLYFNFKDF